MPSLNEIRTRLNQRGVDITSSKWSKRSPSPTQRNAEEYEAEDETRVRRTASNEAVETVMKEIGSPDEPAANTERKTVQFATEEPTADSQKQVLDGANAADTETDPPTPAPDSSGPQAERGREAARAAKGGKKHPLQEVWTLYYDFIRHHGSGGKDKNKDQFEATLKCIGNFTTLESFFDTFATLHRPSQLEKNSNYHLFKRGIKPMWEDAANADGGRWILTLRAQNTSPVSQTYHGALLDRCWMWLVFGLIGEHFDDNDIVSGAVCSLRGKGDRIALWTRKKTPVEEVNALGNKLLDLLQLKNERNVHMEFSVNHGAKNPEYISMHNLPGKSAAPEELDEQDTRVDTWLDSELTLHPADHARYYSEQQKMGGENAVNM